MRCSINERISQIIEYFHENSLANFIEVTKLPEQDIKKLLQNKITSPNLQPLPSAEILVTILCSYPEIYSNWLLHGQGEMLLTQMFNKVCAPLEKVFFSQLKVSNQQIKNLAIENGRLIEKIQLYKIKK